MVRDGRLTQPERFGQVADAGLIVLVRGDHGNQPEPDGICQGLEDAGEVGGLAGSDRLAQQGCAALGGQREDRLLVSVNGCGHLISMHYALTNIDA